MRANEKCDPFIARQSVTECWIEQVQRCLWVFLDVLSGAGQHLIVEAGYLSLPLWETRNWRACLTFHSSKTRYFLIFRQMVFKVLPPIIISSKDKYFNFSYTSDLSLYEVGVK